MFCIEYLVLRIILRLYVNNQYRFTAKTVILFLSMWGFCVAMYGIYYNWCKFITPMILFSLVAVYGPPVMTCASLIIRMSPFIFIVHWMKNDYSFLESAKKAPPNSTHGPADVREDSDSSLRAIRVEDVRRDTFASVNNSTRKPRPKTSNDYKVIGISL